MGPTLHPTGPPHQVLVAVLLDLHGGMGVERLGDWHWPIKNISPLTEQLEELKWGKVHHR